MFSLNNSKTIIQSFLGMKSKRNLTQESFTNNFSPNDKRKTSKSIFDTKVCKAKKQMVISLVTFFFAEFYVF